MEHRVCLAAHAQPALVTRRLILALPTGQRRNRCSYQVATHSIPSRPVPSHPVPSHTIPVHTIPSQASLAENVCSLASTSVAASSSCSAVQHPA